MVKEIAVCAGMLASVLLNGEQPNAREITGTVRLDAAHGNTPLPAMLVSDGYHFAETDAQGHYRLTLSPKATTVYVHRAAGYWASASDFWHRIIPQRSEYDFMLHPVKTPAGPEFTMIVIGDSETGNMDFAAELRDFIHATPNAALMVAAGDMANWQADHLLKHRHVLSRDYLGVPAVFACGNHDVDFRGKGFFGSECPFQSVFGPWWQSFEVGEYLFVTVPIYESWVDSAPTLYNMLDCGDWLKNICQRFPGKKKILLCHDLPDLVGLTMKTHSGEVHFDEENFICALYAHKHMDIVRKYDSGRKSFSTATPNKGGAGCFPPSFRSVTIDGKTGKISSELWRPTLKNHLQLTILPDGSLCATVCHGGTPIREVRVTCGSEEIRLHRTGMLTWQGKLPARPTQKLQLTAITAHKEKLTREFDVESENSALWLTKLPGETAMCCMKPVNGLLVAGISDDANAEHGGLYALNPETGEIVWKFVSGYGIRNDFVTDGQNIYAIDTRANIYAVNGKTGELVWRNDSDPNIVSPSASALICHDGIVAGGYGRHLRGISADNGRTIWRNTGWAVEERTPAEDKLALVDNDSFLVLSRLNGVYRQNLRTGKVLWLFERILLSGTPFIFRDQVLVAGDDVIYRLSLADGHLISEHPNIPCKAATAPFVSLGNDQILISSHTNGIGLYDGTSMKEKWRFMPGPALLANGEYYSGLPASVTAAPLPAGSVTYAAGNDGGIYCIDSNTGKGKLIFQCGAPVFSRPLLHDGTLFFIDSEGRVTAKLLKSETETQGE